MESPTDGRPVFIMPWYGKLMIGTTELLFEQTPDKTQPTQEEINYLLKTLFYYFPDLEKEKVQIENSFAGLRVLPRSQENPNQRSRETIFLTDRKKKPRMVSIFGGKLTAYRATAEQALDKIKPSLPERKALANTKKLPLSVS